MPEGLADLVVQHSRSENTAQLLNALAGENAVKALALFAAMPETYRLVESFGTEAPGTVELPRTGDPLLWLQENAEERGADAEACLVPLERDGREEGCLCMLVGGDAPQDFIASNALKAFAAYELEGIIEIRRRAELEALAEANREMFRALFDNLPHPAVVIRAQDGLIEHANPAFERTTRLPIAEIIGKSLWEFPNLPAEGLREAVSRAARTRQEVFIRLTGGLGGGRWPEPAFVGIGAAIVDPQTICVFIHDFSETLNLRSRLLNAEKRGAAHNVIRKIAHDINNPLAAISGFAQLLAKDQQSPDEVKHQSQRILDQAQRCRSTVRELAEIARQPVHPNARIDVNDLVRAAVQLHAVTAQELGVGLVTELNDHLPSILGDPTEVQCVFDEAIANSLEAFREAARAGTVTVRTLADERGVVIEVEDDAGGAQEPKRVFERFYTTRRLEPHLGMGLTLIKAMAEDYGGEATFENTDRGARLRITLPPQA